MFDDTYTFKNITYHQLHYVNIGAERYVEGLHNYLNNTIEAEFVKRFPHTKLRSNIYQIFTTLNHDYTETLGTVRSPVPQLFPDHNFVKHNPHLTLEQLTALLEITSVVIYRALEKFSAEGLMRELNSVLIQVQPQSETITDYVRITGSEDATYLFDYLEQMAEGDSILHRQVREKQVAHELAGDFCSDIVRYEFGELYEINGYTISEKLNNAFMLTTRLFSAGTEKYRRDKIFFRFAALLIELDIENNQNGVYASLTLHGEAGEHGQHNARGNARALSKLIIPSEENHYRRYFWIDGEYPVRIKAVRRGKEFERAEDVLGQRVSQE